MNCDACKAPILHGMRSCMKCGWDNTSDERCCVKCLGPVIIDTGPLGGSMQEVLTGVVGVVCFFVYGMWTAIAVAASLYAFVYILDALFAKYHCGKCKWTPSDRLLLDVERAMLMRSRFASFMKAVASGAAGGGLLLAYPHIVAWLK